MSKLSDNLNSGESWRGYTLDELKQRRVVALVKRELSREKLAAGFNQARGNFTANGVRGMLFSKDTVAKLKFTDYLLLGWKVVKGIYRFRNRNKR